MKKSGKKKVLVLLIAVVVLGVAAGFKSDFFGISREIEIFTTLFKKLNMNYVDETDPEALMDAAIKGMLEELDPYTQFLKEEDVETYKIHREGGYSGIGALVRADKSKLLLVEPYQGYAADKAGLKAGDEIIAIDTIELADFEGNAIGLLRGAEDSRLSIDFVRQGERRRTTLTREEVAINAVPFSTMLTAKTGYIVLSQFNGKAFDQTKAALRELKRQGAESLVLDLRGNPGGLLSEAIKVTNLFVAKGELIVSTKSKVKKFNKVYRTHKEPEDTEMPLVILIDGKSASASEIVSGGLQDLDRAVILGARSFGKGLVQRPVKLAGGTALKVTIARYYTPSGRCIQAVNYQNRDSTGGAVRNTKFSAFTTKKGREVWDGGGILPDVQISSSASNPLSDVLQEHDVIFDFATDFYYKHTFKSVDSFAFSEADFETFKQFVQARPFPFQTQTEALLEECMRADTSLLGGKVQEHYKVLLLALKNEKMAALDSYKKELRKKLEDEILKRYFYRKGVYAYHIMHDEAILAAKALLKDKATYRAILN